MNDSTNNPKEGLFSHTDDFVSLSRTAHKYPSINELEIKDKSHYESLIEITINDENIIPLFFKDTNGELEIILSYSKSKNEFTSGCKLVYLGKRIDQAS